MSTKRAPKPSEIRDAVVVTITRYGEDRADIEMENGKSHEMDIDELLHDWLYLHRKYREAKSREEANAKQTVALHKALHSLRMLGEQGVRFADAIATWAGEFVTPERVAAALKLLKESDDAQHIT